MNKMIFRSSVLIFGFGLILSACGGKPETTTDASDEFAAAESQITDNITTVVYDIPPPSQIPGLLERSGVEYNFELLNEESKADSYTSSSDKAALNLGVYASDVGYLIAYEKVQEALNYMGTSRGLAEELGLTGTFEAAVIQQFEQNLDNRDSLVLLLNNTISNSEEYLNNDKRQRTAALMLAGSLIEGLHISCQLIKTYPSDLPDEVKNIVLSDLIRIILEQEKSVSEVAKMLHSIDQKQPVGELVTQFASLQEQYKNINISEQIANNQGSLVLSDEFLVEITSIVEDIRSTITK